MYNSIIIKIVTSVQPREIHLARSGACPVKSPVTLRVCPVYEGGV